MIIFLSLLEDRSTRFGPISNYIINLILRIFQETFHFLRIMIKVRKIPKKKNTFEIHRKFSDF